MEGISCHRDTKTGWYLSVLPLAFWLAGFFATDQRRILSVYTEECVSTGKPCSYGRDNHGHMVVVSRESSR